LDYALYNGEVNLAFDAGTHRYFVGEERVWIPSVTGICGVVDKPSLIPWAARETADYWRAAIQPDCSYDGQTLETVYYASKKAHRQRKQEAASIGTQTHRALEEHFAGTDGSSRNNEQSWPIVRVSI